MWEGNKYISMITFEPNFASIPKKKNGLSISIYYFKALFVEEN